MNLTEPPVRSSSMNVTPPAVPMPGMAGGGNANEARRFGQRTQLAVDIGLDGIHLQLRQSCAPTKASS